MISPNGYFDVQVNGYAGVDFNADSLSLDDLRMACARLREHGVAQILATVITDELDRMTHRLKTIASLRQRDWLIRDVIAGVHIEGPFISSEPGYVGAHPVAAVRNAETDVMKRLLDAAEGLTRIVTLAPERDEGFRVTRMLAEQGVLVSAGHCNPTQAELHGSLDAGLSMFTHLGNGCPMYLHRHDNIIQRVLGLSDRLYISFIADGAHVPFVALRNYLQLVPPDRVIIISDAISAAGCGPGTYRLGDQFVEIHEDLVPRAPDGSHFVGSACTMRRMAENLLNQQMAPDADIQQWLVENPRRLITGRTG